jgi:hypothetical protein
MGSYDGAETCELVGLLLLSELQTLNINIGLYRDDGLAACTGSPRQIENIKKRLCNTFSKHKLRITIEANKKSADFLDINLDLRTGYHKPFMKPNNTPLYVHSLSNHPPAIIKNIPESINQRLSQITTNEELFKNSVQPYQKALSDSGYKHTLKYNPSYNNNSARRRIRNVTWYNPPYSTNVTTNIGRKFLKLLQICFPEGHKLKKVVNHNNIKISYSCMPNIKQLINKHNQRLLNSRTNTSQERTCNCRNRDLCPLQGSCLTSGIIYQASVTRLDNNRKETYIGLTETTFKSRYNNHKSSLNNPRQKNTTALSKYVWTLKDQQINYTLNWKIISRALPYSPTTKRCNLCITEKFYIIYHPKLASLNSRCELANSCRHFKKFLLCNYNPG